MRAFYCCGTLHIYFTFLSFVEADIEKSDLRGSVCNPVSYLRPLLPHRGKFLVCKIIENESVGVWTETSCRNGTVFDLKLQGCSTSDAISSRRSSYCPNCAASVSVNQCQIDSSKPPNVGRPCQWLNPTLEPHIADSSAFLQCVPNRLDSLSQCGTWQMMNCGPHYDFVPNLQLCIAKQLQRNSACPVQQTAVCHCGSNSICPRGTQCMTTVCCVTRNFVTQPVTSRPMIPRITHPMPQPINFGFTPISTLTKSHNCPTKQANIPCNSFQLCAFGFACVGTSCCQLPMCTNGKLAMKVCFDDNECNPQMICTNFGCCSRSISHPRPMPSSTLPTRTTIGALAVQRPMCRLGGLSVSICNIHADCPNGYECYDGGCCVIKMCPNNERPKQKCDVFTKCPYGYQCNGGLCCPSSMPICPETRQLSTRICQTDSQCYIGTYCYRRVGCCPLAMCPNGVTAKQSCQSGRSCMPNQSCINGVCCELELCPDETLSLQACTDSSHCKGISYCHNRKMCCPLKSCPASLTTPAPLCRDHTDCSGGKVCTPELICCDQPKCPNNTAAASFCIGPVNTQSNCFIDEFCTLDKICCKLPRCPDGKLTRQLCDSNAVATGRTTCQNGGICMPGGYCCEKVIPSCPYGSTPTRQCVMSMQCTRHETCTSQGVCCPTPLCPDGRRGVMDCSSSMQCPESRYCHTSKTCCQLPQCPFGQKASQPCGVGFACPSGAQCMNAGCCSLQLLPTCPNGSRAAKFCDPGDYLQCPNSFKCINMGCCPSDENVVASALVSSNVQFGTKYSGKDSDQSINYSVVPEGCIPVCHCAIQNQVCPFETKCDKKSNICCSKGPSRVYGIAIFPPGAPCKIDAECSGYPLLGSCLNHFCTCMNGGRSDGARCSARVSAFNAKIHCNQFLQTDCDSKTTEAAKTVPRFAEPDFWESVVSHCESDEDCTPDKLCSNGKSCQLRV